MARRDGARTIGAKVIAVGALRCANAACTALPREVYAVNVRVRIGETVVWEPEAFRVALSLDSDPDAPRVRTELDLTIADRTAAGSRRCNVCSFLLALNLLAERAGLTGERAS